MCRFAMEVADSTVTSSGEPINLGTFTTGLLFLTTFVFSSEKATPGKTNT